MSQQRKLEFVKDAGLKGIRGGSKAKAEGGLVENGLAQLVPTGGKRRRSIGSFGNQMCRGRRLYGG